MKTTIAITLAIGFATSLLSGAGETPRPRLDRTARESIIAAANQAIQKHMKVDRQERKGTEIAKALWGEAITRLKPLRVRDDKVNVFIVLQEDEATEAGLYVSIVFSSYAPGVDKRFVEFEKMSQPEDKAFGILYWCRLTKAQPTGCTNAGIASRLTIGHHWPGVGEPEPSL
jgi:ribosomal protein L31E